MVYNTMKENKLLGEDCKREELSVCLRSKRSEVRILSGVPKTLGSGSADLLPDSGKSENKASKTLAGRPPRKRNGIRAWLEYHRARITLNTPVQDEVETARIRLSGGLYVKVDPEDLQEMLRYKWRCSDHEGRWNYARTGRGVLMHRLMIGAKPGEIVDHINGDTLDNRKANLRKCSNADNIANSRKYRGGGTSSFKGVYRSGPMRWRAQICVSGKKVNLGAFSSEKEAAEAYDRAASASFGQFARLNPKRGDA